MFTFSESGVREQRGPLTGLLILLIEPPIFVGGVTNWTKWTTNVADATTGATHFARAGQDRSHCFLAPLSSPFALSAPSNRGAFASEDDKMRVQSSASARHFSGKLVVTFVGTVVGGVL